jgi:lipopolysaccharide/colanic/teichoic acid biosynthesis glycosyltransferase
MTTGLQVKEIGSVPLVTLDRVRLKGMFVVLKTALDYAVALPVLIVLSPLLLLTALTVRLGSPGPILHRRRVMGMGGRQFDALKFRTMAANADEILEDNPELKAQFEHNHKLKNDPRVTPVGRFLRRWSLDELPQLINVLKRDMSLVGPRMISPSEHREYGKWGMNLLTVRPGITGLWQVSGRSDVSYEERVRLDMYYIRNYSILLDLQILFVQTLPAVLKGKGAY